MFLIKLLNSIIILLVVFLSSCTQVRESAGVTRKSIDEFQAVENAPLVIPPEFNLIAPDQLEQKNVDDIEKELAQEILFGLDKEEKIAEKQLSTMNQILLQADANNVSEDIRNEINEDFAQEKKTEGIFKTNWKNEIEVLDAVKESERIRNKNFDDKSIVEDNILIQKEKVKVKKKKRFIFF